MDRATAPIRHTVHGGRLSLFTGAEVYTVPAPGPNHGDKALFALGPRLVALSLAFRLTLMWDTRRHTISTPRT